MKMSDDRSSRPHLPSRQAYGIGATGATLRQNGKESDAQEINSRGWRSAHLGTEGRYGLSLGLSKLSATSS
jgi:hypothetical protein